MQNNKLYFDTNNISDLSIKEFSKSFIEKNKYAINKMCNRFYNNNSHLSKLATEETIYQEIKKILQSIVKSKRNILDIEQYIFSCINNITKNINTETRGKVYICPGCKFKSKSEIIDISIDKLICYSCKDAISYTKDKLEENFYRTFAEHSIKGFRCPDCNNFIPDTKDKQISCPYINCSFTGETNTLKLMKHPTIKVNMEIQTMVNPVSDKATDTEVMVKDDINSYLKIINECIENEINITQSKSNGLALINKLCMCDSIKNTIDKYPNEMISYLIFLNRDVRIQHKIFQEFINLIEDKIPFSFISAGNCYSIGSIFDENLYIFDGISEFYAVVNEKHEIPNLTNEKYISGKNCLRQKPYFIGKVLEVINTDINNSIINSIKEYSFSKIIMDENINPGTNVSVKHLRVIPHYQMGILNCLNRIRRSIVDRAYFILNGKDRINVT